MAFVNFSLLLGGALMAIPIVVHLTMRRKPRHQLFPALRFLQERRESNRRQLELRHWLLLFLRCVLIGLLAMALARPSVDEPRFAVAMLGGLLLAVLVFAASTLVFAHRHQAGKKWVAGLGTLCGLLAIALIVLLATAGGRGASRRIGSQRAPVAAALIIDTSPRMEYRFENQTRLEAAQAMASWLLDQLPEGSQIAVLESRPGPAIFSVDLSAARTAVGRLQTTAVAEPLAQTVLAAIQLLDTSSLDRKELFLFGDLAAASWPADLAASVRRAYTETRDLTGYVIDVGLTDPANTSIGDLQLSAERGVQRGEVTIAAAIRNLGPQKNQVVELLLEQPQDDRPLIVDGEVLLPPAIRRDQASLSLATGDAQTVQFQLSGLTLGVHHGAVRLPSSDSLAADDIRHFTIEIRPAWPLLVAAPPNTPPDLFTEAINPYEFRQADKSAFDCQVVRQGELAAQDLSRFAAVCLLDPQPIGADSLSMLNAYVRAGGGLALFLGHNAQPAERFFSPAMNELVGATFSGQWRAAGREVFLAPDRFDHPVLAPLRNQATAIPWSDAPVFRHWIVDKPAEQTAVVIPFSNGKPALLEHHIGSGQVVTLTTPVTDPFAPRGRSTWNELPTSENAWPYLVLVNELMHYLVDRDRSRLNFQPGETVVLDNDSARDPQRYRLFSPEQEPLDVTAGGGQVTIGFTEQPGTYRLKGRRGSLVTRGFSINVPASLLDLTRLDADSLANFFGDDYFYARKRDEIVIRVGQARSGREFYPYLVAALVLVVGLEHLLANRFYRGQA